MMRMSMNVLVVDDERDTQELFSPALPQGNTRRACVVFHFAMSGDEALEYLKTGHTAEYLLVLSDINMPGMSGFELLKKIRESFGPLKVYMITAYDDAEKQQCAVEYGADGYMCKPINLTILKYEIFGADATL